jgi:hypothetical protein
MRRRRTLLAAMGSGRRWQSPIIPAAQQGFRWWAPRAAKPAAIAGGCITALPAAGFCVLCCAMSGGAVSWKEKLCLLAIFLACVAAGAVVAGSCVGAAVAVFDVGRLLLRRRRMAGR